jgi:DNA-directed RNA polymerase specialized sigma24 family protein
MRLLRYPPQGLQNGGGYILRIAANVLHDFRARYQLESRLVESVNESNDNELMDVFRAEEDVGRLAEQADWIESILIQMSLLHRVAILLCKRDGHSYAEAAEKLGMPLNTFKRHLADAIGLFKVLASKG